MKKKIALATLAILPMTATSAHASGETGIVTATSLNVRNGASTSHTVLFTVKKNDKVDITSSSNGWYKIKTSAGKEGWASATYISKTGSSSDTSSSTIKQVSVDRLNMRSGASTSYRVITVLTKGTNVEVMSESNGWSKVKHDGRIGYVSTEYIKAVNTDSTNTVTKKVNTNNLNVRSGPSTSYSVIGKLQTGAKVEVISESNGWSKIKHSGREAYVSSMYLDNIGGSTTPETPDNKPEEIKETKVVNTNNLNVRSGPSTSNSKIGTLAKGTKVGVISESNGWSKIDYNGKEAYVSSQYLDKISTTPEQPEKPETPEETKETKVVNTSSLNVRSGPSTSSSKIGSLAKGSKVEVLSESNGWSKINYNGKDAYVSSQYLDKVGTTPEQPEQPETPETPEETKEMKVVNTSSLNVRSGPSTSSQKLGSLTMGTKVEVLSESNGWSKINYNGKEAYVSSQYLSKDNGSTGGGSNVGGTENVNGATINYKGLNYTLASHVDKQMDRVSQGGNVIDSSKPRSVDAAVQSMEAAQARGFIKADRSDIEYFLNPANFTKSSKGMMQFLRLDSYKGGITADELNSYFNSLGVGSQGTNVFHGQGQSFINAAQKHNIDLAYLVSHAMWETGYGKSVLAQGQTITSYKGQPLDKPTKVYNFFGIGAIDQSANVSGAEAAYSNGWTSVEATIDGSAQWIAQNYIKSSKYNQNTIYKMKWNYDYTWHQYATDVNWCNGISGIMNKIITMYDTGNNLVFEVPQYK
ncbi:SH3 domain-containing protein [Romboutsia weinsteinii]|uniref:SH3 domain-containing protein n=1 Tax=Romboutsia weinsteinii TaxID=2020949 RepID=UPI001314A89C|nr:SH3 domain-containing protein [Romboutsia weinsteinii]